MTNVQKRKTDPKHKAQFGVVCMCSCGWVSATAFTKGARTETSKQWHNHRDKCEKSSENA